ncbi:glycosyl hydrolase family 28-related protein [Pedobacter antarcticus]|uniref:glycosyl hydrolase family 28-related protein n=1 Tax=Pedobacter antarcticus TaxID=34086 RepID=UPI00292E3742|nr:glycosyl hydrolase family 28-related protein [Pedobacter antarcticus]
MVILTINDLKINSGTSANNYITVLGYYESGDGGGGNFYWAGNSMEADNGGTIFKVSNVSQGRWKRIYSGEVNVKWFGAIGNNSFDNYAAFSAASTFLSNSPYGGTMYIPEGKYLLETGIEFNQLVGDESAIRRISVNGSGPGSTEIIYNGVGNAFRFYSQYAGAVVQNYSISNFKLIKDKNLHKGIGIKIEYSAFMEMHNIKVELFQQGLMTDNFLGAAFYSCIFNRNNYGVVMQGEFLPPNDVNLYSCTFSSNRTLALYVSGGVLLNIFGGDVEGNGWYPTAIRQGGVVIDTGTTGIGGTVSANIHGVYFEGNGGLADVMYYAGNGAGLSILNIYGSTFNRLNLSIDRFVINNITAQLGNHSNSPVKINVRDCGFSGFNDYISDETRKYISINSTGAKFTFSDEGSIYADPKEIPKIKGITLKDKNKISTGVVFRGSDGSIINSIGNVSNIFKNGIGDYTIVFEQEFLTPWYLPSLCSNEPAVLYTFANFVNQLRIKSEDNHGNPKDVAAIYLTISGGDF